MNKKDSCDFRLQKDSNFLHRDFLQDMKEIEREESERLEHGNMGRIEHGNMW